jgi:hypothetical protein
MNIYEFHKSWGRSDFTLSLIERRRVNQYKRCTASASYCRVQYWMSFLRSLSLEASSLARKNILRRPSPAASTLYLLSGVSFVSSISSTAQSRATSNMSSDNLPSGKSEEEWRAILSPQQVCLLSPPIFAQCIKIAIRLVQDSPRERYRSCFQRRVRQALSYRRRICMCWMRHTPLHCYH